MSLIDDVDGLQSIYINRATGNGNDDDERYYPIIRKRVLDDTRADQAVPTHRPSSVPLDRSR